MKNAADFGLRVDGEVGYDFTKMMERKDTIVAQLVKGIGFLLKKNKVDLVQGKGRLFGDGKVEVQGDEGIQMIEADHVVIASGSEAALIRALNYNGDTVITSKEALHLTEVPESLLVIGGGVIGCEFAMIFAELGTKVTIVEALDRVLPMVDAELSKRMKMVLKKRKMTLHTGKMIKEVTDVEGGIRATLEDGSTIEAQKALISIGRTFNTEGLGLEEAGVKLGERGEILVDEYLATSAQGVYAIGDVTNKIQLAHVASAQGIVCVENLFGDGEKSAMSYDVVPNCIFTNPEIASVGLTEEQAAEKGVETKVGKFPFQALGKAMAIGHTDGFVKIITDASDDRIIGVHVMGPHATDLIAEGALAMQHGLTAGQLAKTIHAHPTLSESFMEAAEAVHGLSVHS